MKRIYYGWWLVVMAMAIYVLVVGTTFPAFSLYVLPASAELHLTRAEANTGLVLMHLGNAVLGPFAGRLLDRVSARKVMIASALIFAASFTTLGLSTNLWLTGAVLAVGIASGYLGAGTITNTVLIARWFKAHRGRAMALINIGMNLGTLLVSPLIGWLIETVGWRRSLLFSGVALLALLLPLALLVRDRPGPDDIETTRAATDGGHATAAAPRRPLKVGEVLRAPQFWSISLSCALALGMAGAVLLSLVPFARAGGLSMLQASSLLSASGAGAIVGALSLAVVADRVDRVLFLTACIAFNGLLNLALLADHSYPLLLAVSAGIGLVNGALTPSLFALLADRFGAASFGTVRGLSLPVIAGMSMLCLRFAGEVFDRTGGYDVMLRTFFAVGLIAAGVMFATRYVDRKAARVAN